MAGDREMNLTADEASALGYAVLPRLRPRHRRERQAPGEPPAALVVAAVIALIVLLIAVSYRGASPASEAQNAEQQHQPTATIRAEEPADAQATTAQSPERRIQAPSQRVLEYLPTGWEWAYAAEDTQLFDTRSIRIGVIPQGIHVFYTSAATPLGQMVVAEDGSFWGYLHTQWTAPEQRALELRPEWHKAVAIIYTLTARGYLQQMPPQSEESQSTESESILPEGYGYGCIGTIPGYVGQGQWLLSISHHDGRAYQVTFMPYGTCLVVDVSPTPYRYRKVASLDGKYRGYAWFPGTRRPRMTPDMKSAIELIKQIP